MSPDVVEVDLFKLLYMGVRIVRWRIVASVSAAVLQCEVRSIYVSKLRYASNTVVPSVMTAGMDRGWKCI